MALALSEPSQARTGARSLLIELAGPAGVGKSTLSAQLVRRLQATPATIWGLPVLPLLTNGAQLVPTFAALWAHSGSPLWDETRHMVRLRTLRRAVGRAAPHRNGSLIFDEGPVFAMAWLRGFGRETLRQHPSEEWWEATLQEWAAILDLVIVLDAPDQLLAARIRTRPTPHEVKDFPDQEIARWMARFRQALDWVLSGMARHGGPKVLRLSGLEQPAELIAADLATEIREAVHGR